MVEHGFLPLVCYANGSLSREKVKDMFGKREWSDFEAAVSLAAPGNNGLIGLFYLVPEIVPKVPKSINRPIFFSKEQQQFIQAGEVMDALLTESSYPTLCRAILESRACAIRHHTTQLGLSARRVILTGGGARSTAFAQILANVLQVSVYSQPIAGASSEAQHNSAAFGAALRALHGSCCADQGKLVSFDEISRDFLSSNVLVATPQKEFANTYHDLFDSYVEAEKALDQIIS